MVITIFTTKQTPTNMENTEFEITKKVPKAKLETANL